MKHLLTKTSVMKKGDLVTIKDGSYMTTIRDGKISHYGKFESTKIIGHNEEKFTVIDIDGSYPADDYLNKQRRNNTIIQNNDNSEIWFCDRAICLKAVKKTIPELTVKQLIDMVGYEFKIIK